MRLRFSHLPLREQGGQTALAENQTELIMSFPYSRFRSLGQILRPCFRHLGRLLWGGRVPRFSAAETKRKAMTMNRACLYNAVRHGILLGLALISFAPRQSVCPAMCVDCGP